MAWLYRGNTQSTIDSVGFGRRVPQLSMQSAPAAFKPIITTRRALVAGGTSANADMKLRVKLDVLLDVRYNPFEEASEHNEEGDFKNLKKYANLGYIPVRLLLYNAAGEVIYHLVNSKPGRALGGYDSDNPDNGWKPGAGQWGDMWLAYYDNADRVNSTGFGGWTTNKQCIWTFAEKLPSMFRSLPDGEFIPLPPVSGYIELQVAAGVYIADDNNDPRLTERLFPQIWWMLYRDPAVSFVDKYYKEPDNDDIEYFGYINPDAEEEITLDTTCGSLGDATPLARGAYMVRGTDGGYSWFDVIRRGQTTAQYPERILLSTLIEQYSQRRDALSGEADAIAGAPVLRTDAALPGKRFITLAERYDVRAAAAELELSELVPDTYQPIIAEL